MTPTGTVASLIKSLLADKETLAKAQKITSDIEAKQAQIKSLQAGIAELEGQLDELTQGIKVPEGAAQKSTGKSREIEPTEGNMWGRIARKMTKNRYYSLADLQELADEHGIKASPSTLKHVSRVKGYSAKEENGHVKYTFIGTVLPAKRRGSAAR